MRSKQVFHILSSLIIVVVIEITPSYPIQAQKENKENDPLIILTSIKNLLQKSITELTAGNYTGASELVEIAYIDNYEYIEDPLKELDQDLMEETEVMIREDFIDAIEDKIPIEEITTLYNNTKTNLDKAEQLFKQ
jgi:hypothetical protein